MSLYLILNLASLSIPFLYSFEKKMRFIQWWKEVFLSIIIVGVFFIIWDINFTKNGIWGFNENYLVGLSILGLPIEEWLFFICIPYASIFIHYAFQYFFPTISLSIKITNIITISLILLLLIVAIKNYDKAYTFYNYIILSVLLLYSYFTKNRQLPIFYITFLIILIPMLLVNGILTGSFIEEPVVWYNNSENLGIRLGTMPIEDIGYAFTMLFGSIVLIEKIKKSSLFTNKNKATV
ncbi:lycopene cyclase domain-containing protein [Aureibaculum sp. 2210JD6-5]|uniref:lycopene cyclase domain-containing protein n=1 Tax=Aureibaculum sp. 2210JD6-5 TaxID=3103957 RepID=UPI002AADA50B|nr:lycopene cyclase domain-containing protein [Aureibaculum sp. 2210JD6-5]MDY7394259.1 lycopene cyclase domain-containing protein [Aureibaculum sp. 2210JD6-5]